MPNITPEEMVEKLRARSGDDELYSRAAYTIEKLLNELDGADEYEERLTRTMRTFAASHLRDGERCTADTLIRAARRIVQLKKRLHGRSAHSQLEGDSDG